MTAITLIRVLKAPARPRREWSLPAFLLSVPYPNGKILSRQADPDSTPGGGFEISQFLHALLTPMIFSNAGIVFCDACMKLVN